MFFVCIEKKKVCYANELKHVRTLNCQNKKNKIKLNSGYPMTCRPIVTGHFISVLIIYKEKHGFKLALCLITLFIVHLLS